MNSNPPNGGIHNYKLKKKVKRKTNKTDFILRRVVNESESKSAFRSNTKSLQLTLSFVKAFRLKSLTRYSLTLSHTDCQWAKASAHVLKWKGTQEKVGVLHVCVCTIW